MRSISCRQQSWREPSQRWRVVKASGYVGEEEEKKNWIYKDSISKTGKEEDHKKKEKEEEKEEEESSSDSNHKKRQPLATWNLDLICIRNAELRERKGTQPNNA